MSSASVLYLIIYFAFCVFEMRTDHSELFLTPLIKDGKISQARELSSDHLKDFHIKSSTNENLKSFSGYLTIDEENHSNLFFWFFPALETTQDAPVIMWLNEVAGSSCLKGIFLENGPFYVNDKLELRDREMTWVLKNSMLYIDAPVGTGFSFTREEKGYANNSKEEADQVFEALQQFFTLFSEFKDQDFYLAGEGLSANHIPHMVKKIEYGNSNEALVKINLKGFILGSPLFNTIIQARWSGFWYEMGLIDEQQKIMIKSAEDKMQDLILAKEYGRAHEEGFKIIFTPTSLFAQLTGIMPMLNILNATTPRQIINFANFIEDKEVHNYLHAGLHNFEIFNFKVHDRFNSEIMAGDGKALESVLENYKVLLYNGQMDPFQIQPLAIKGIEAMNWSYAEDLKKVPRRVWRVKDEVAGYVKSVGKFTHVAIRKAGRYAMMDEPQWVFQMLQNFIEDKPFEN